MSIGSNIERLRNQHDWTQEDLAQKVGVSRSTITQWENGWTRPRMGNVQLLAGVFGVSTGVIVAEGESDAPDGAIKPAASEPAYAPLLGRVHAGKAQEPDILDDRIPVPYEVIKFHPQAYFLQVEGDCMDRVYPEGCYILIDPEKQPQNGSIAVVSIDGADYVMRRLFRGANTLVLSPDSHNPEHKDLVISSTSEHTVEFHGTVIWFQSSREME